MSVAHTNSLVDMTRTEDGDPAVIYRTECLRHERIAFMLRQARNNDVLTAHPDYGNQLAGLVPDATANEALPLLEIWLARFNSGFPENEKLPDKAFLNFAKILVPLVYQNTREKEDGTQSTEGIHGRVVSLVEEHIGKQGRWVNLDLTDYADRFLALVDKYSRQDPILFLYRFDHDFYEQEARKARAFMDSIGTVPVGILTIATRDKATRNGMTAAKTETTLPQLPVPAPERDDSIEALTARVRLAGMIL